MGLDVRCSFRSTIHSRRAALLMTAVARPDEQSDEPTGRSESARFAAHVRDAAGRGRCVGERDHGVAGACEFGDESELHRGDGAGAAGGGGEQSDVSGAQGHLAGLDRGGARSAEHREPGVALLPER